MKTRRDNVAHIPTMITVACRTPKFQRIRNRIPINRAIILIQFERKTRIVEIDKSLLMPRVKMNHRNLPATNPFAIFLRSFANGTAVVLGKPVPRNGVIPPKSLVRKSLLKTP